MVGLSQHQAPPPSIPTSRFGGTRARTAALWGHAMGGGDLAMSHFNRPPVLGHGTNTHISSFYGCTEAIRILLGSHQSY